MSFTDSVIAAQQPARTPSQQGQPAAPAPPSIPQAYQASLPTPTQSGMIPGYSLPQPTNSGSLDLSSIKPVNTGSVSIADAVAKARGIAAEKGVSYEPGRGSTGKENEGSVDLGALLILCT
jgi:far upstream element-binding protein